MVRLLLTAAGSLVALAATLALAAPAAAVDRPGLSRAESARGVVVHRGSGHRGSGFSPVEFRRDGDRRRLRGSGGEIYIGDREYQGDTAWRPDGFNDWWHERPLRNEPRWLRSNNCERQYWTGGGWRC